MMTVDPALPIETLLLASSMAPPLPPMAWLFKSVTLPFTIIELFCAKTAPPFCEAVLLVKVTFDALLSPMMTDWPPVL